MHLIRELELARDVELALDIFGKAIDHHIRFEEREWFESIQKTANEDLLIEIGKRISSSRQKEKTTNF